MPYPMQVAYTLVSIYTCGLVCLRCQLTSPFEHTDSQLCLRTRVSRQVECQGRPRLHTNLAWTTWFQHASVCHWAASGGAACSLDIWPVHSVSPRDSPAVQRGSGKGVSFRRAVAGLRIEYNCCGNYRSQSPIWPMPLNTGGESRKCNASKRTSHIPWGLCRCDMGMCMSGYSSLCSINDCY